jgi:hypothetical protein
LLLVTAVEATPRTAAGLGLLASDAALGSVTGVATAVEAGVGGAGTASRTSIGSVLVTVLVTALEAALRSHARAAAAIEAAATAEGRITTEVRAAGEARAAAVVEAAVALPCAPVGRALLARAEALVEGLLEVEAARCVATATFGPAIGLAAAEATVVVAEARPVSAA